MKIMLIRCLVLLLGYFATSSVHAESYEVSLTRKGGNVYKVDGKDVIIHTRHCYVYAYSEDSILKSTGYGGEVIFIDSKDRCDVKAIYGISKQKAGKYSVTVSREDDDWYEVFGTSTYIRTSSCLSLALGEEAYLNISVAGSGRLVFKDGNSCMVDGIYSKMRL